MATKDKFQTREELKADIEQAQKQLHAVHDLTPGDRDLVGNLLTDIVAHLTEHEAEQDEPAHEVRNKIVGQLEQQVERLETEHPRLASMLGRIASMLSSLGV